MAFSDPEKNIEKLGVQKRAYVADLGAGSGFYTFAAARHVGKGGKVYAVDIQSSLLARIKNQAHALHLDTIEVIQGDIEQQHGTRLKDHSVDAVILSNVLFQITDEEGLFTEIRRILKPQGRILVVDWNDSYKNTGPHPKHMVIHVVAEKLLKKHQFTPITTFDAGHHHYGLIYSIS